MSIKSISDSSVKKTRNNSADLLRIVAMLMIIAWHLVGHGGVLTAYSDSSLGYNLTLAVKSICLVAVNCYVLISGYFLIESTFRIKKLISLIMQVVFYSLSIYSIFVTTGLVPLSETGLLESVLPILGGLYWFVSAYVGMYLLSPFINKFIKSIDKKTHLSIITLLVGIFSVWPYLLMFIKAAPSSSLFVSNGYNIVWFVVLYFIAAYLRLYYTPSYKKNFYAWRYLLSAIVTSLLFIGAHYLVIILPDIRTKTFLDNLNDYSSLAALIPSLALFILFLNLKITNTIINKLIITLSPLTFGVYLIHDSPHVRKILWDFLDLPPQAESPYFLLHCLGVVAAIYIVCSSIDWCRIVLFQHISKLPFFRNIGNDLERLLNSTSQKTLILVDKLLRA